jgi:hypothetical protein
MELLTPATSFALSPENNKAPPRRGANQNRLSLKRHAGDAIGCLSEASA